MYEHLLVALDGSPAAEKALDHAEALAIAFRSDITVLRAVVSAETLIAQTSATGTGVGEVAPMVDPTPILEADHSAAADYLGTVAARLRQHGLTVNIEEPEGQAENEIVERAKALDVSLIIMTTHGRSGFARAFFGSVADSVLRHAACPVLLIRIPDK